MTINLIYKAAEFYRIAAESDSAADIIPDAEEPRSTAKEKRVRKPGVRKNPNWDAKANQEMINALRELLGLDPIPQTYHTESSRSSAMDSISDEALFFPTK